jgi:hypothetical protein
LRWRLESVRLARIDGQAKKRGVDKDAGEQSDENAIRLEPIRLDDNCSRRAR